ncbi:unnamed protein product [Parascedosporium putredinis]|uniref:Uncharacterized protein n=1 Tax=Parascedosporium putredinis TaxID=1442378 RepID=A0A9P1GYE1_9PEZI|nr:unnamed protein product [Parascedosporium putredinis]CAI7990604.1 unnamed protein product [Parascedosporium putredinis]
MASLLTLQFFFVLDRNLEDVDSFYSKKLADALRRLNLLHERYGNVPEVVSTLDADEIEELIGALLELRHQLRNLQWFGEINRKGFVKITKKLDKKVPHIATQHGYISTKVDPKPFARDMNVTRRLAEVNKWLSVLGDAQNVDDSRSDRSGRSLGRTSTKGSPSLPQPRLDMLDQAARADDVRSITARSKQCIEYLLANVKSLDEPDDINARNCIHRLVMHIGRTKSSAAKDQSTNTYPFHSGTQFSSQYLQPAASAASSPKALNQNETGLLGREDEAVQLLIFLLDKLSPEQRGALKSKDSFGRFPLHYAAHFGFVVLCEIIMAKMTEWGQFTLEDDLDSPDWQDVDGHGPVHLSVIGGHPKTTQALLTAMTRKQPSANGAGHAAILPVSKSGAILGLATKANFDVIVKMLVNAGLDINWQDKAGRPHSTSPRDLVMSKITESNYSWTPLHVAAVDGQLEIVKLLIDAGANLLKVDASGWMAKEHAALRGHMEIARLLNSETKDSLVAELRPSRSPSPRPETHSIQERRSNGATASKPVELIKSFGHRYLNNESLILVSLGSMDMRKSVDAVKLEKVPLTEAHLTGLDTALSVVVSASGAQGEPTIIDLPVHENIATEPVVFTAHDASEVKILFDIVPTPAVGAKRMSLQGDVCIPIMASNLEVIGTVNFNFLIVTPFSHPKMEITSRQTYWKKLADTMVIGHRGLGKNVSSTRSLQLGENTVPSFIAAANLGAQYVEFDVQLTKDHVPVIYHDFLVSETGIDAPVHTLTLEQFLHINPDSTRAQYKERLGDPRARPRSNSLDTRKSLKLAEEEVRKRTEMEERMRHTRDFKSKGYKANSRGNFIQAPFATLEDLFRKIPENVGFNIEMKYPMLHESEEHEMDTYAVELNSFCDTVLSKVYDLAGDRHIIFSSFNPDICLCLNFKQPSIPIMFLTDAGTSPVGDVRASSLQEAIRFASRWNLLGTVSAAEPFVNSPRLVRVVKERGLVCVSYGVLNNDPMMVQRQVKEGIDAVIVDNVLAIRKGLTTTDTQAAAAQQDPILVLPNLEALGVVG